MLDDMDKALPHPGNVVLALQPEWHLPDLDFNFAPRLGAIDAPDLIVAGSVRKFECATPFPSQSFASRDGYFY